jgi:hypothetical protein
MMQAAPPSTALIVVRTGSALAGSTGSASRSARKGRARHCFAIWVSTANTGRPGQEGPEQQAVEERGVVGGDDGARYHGVGGSN